MTNYNRQGTAPIEDGDPLDASEVEAEFSAIQTVINGGLDNSNLTGSAGITGANIAAGTITNAKMTASTLTTASFATSATVTYGLDTADGGSNNMTNSTSTWAAIQDIGTVTLTPGSNLDIIMLDCTVTCTLQALSTVFAYKFGFEIGGVDPAVDLAYIDRPGTNAETMTVHFSWMYVPGATTPVSIRPMHLAVDHLSDTTVGVFTNGYTNVFRAIVVPIKA